MVLNEYNQIIREHFDLSDRTTSRFITYMNESDNQNQLLAALASSLYQKIVDKCDKVDFGSIPRSRGDITKIDGYNNTVECINIIRRLVVEYKEDPAIIDIELNAIEAIKSLRPVFMKAFNNNSSFAMMYYNLTVASIQHSVSFLIAVAIQFVKDPNSKNIKMALDKAAYKDAESNMVLENLAKLNRAYNDGSLEKLLRESISGSSVRESIEADEYTEEVISGTNDVTDAYNNAPETEGPIDNGDAGQIDEDTLLLQIAGGEDYQAPQEEPGEEQIDNDPFGDSNDELSAGNNVPKTPTDDEVEPTPIIPINGAGESNGTESIEEKKGSIVKRSYHKHPTANAGYGDQSAVGEGAKEVLNTIGTFIGGDLKNDKGESVKRLSWLWSKLGTAGKVGAVAVGVVGLFATLLYLVLPAMRMLVAHFYMAKAKLSEALEQQANLIELNALELSSDENSNLSDEQKEKVIEKQKKWAEKLRKWAYFFSIKDKKASKDAQKDVDEEKKKYKSKDMQEYLPDDTTADDLF